LLNDTSPINIANGKFSNIDVPLSTPSISQRLEWELLNEVYSSDHLPINIKLSTRQIIPKTTKYIDRILKIQTGNYSLIY